MSLADQFAAARADSLARDARNRAAIADESKPAVFASRDGRMLYTVTGSTKGARYQVTVWIAGEPVSDSQHETIDGILSYYRSELYALATAHDLETGN